MWGGELHQRNRLPSYSGAAPGYGSGGGYGNPYAPPAATGYGSGSFSGGGAAFNGGGGGGDVLYSGGKSKRRGARAALGRIAVWGALLLLAAAAGGAGFMLQRARGTLAELQLHADILEDQLRHEKVC